MSEVVEVHREKRAPMFLSLACFLFSTRGIRLVLTMFVFVNTRAPAISCVTNKIGPSYAQQPTEEGADEGGAALSSDFLEEAMRAPLTWVNPKP